MVLHDTLLGYGLGDYGDAILPRRTRLILLTEVAQRAILTALWREIKI